MTKIGTILVATDGSAASGAAVEQSVALAGGLGARLIVINVVNQPVATTTGSVLTATRDSARDEAEEIAREVADEAQRAGVDATYLIREGQPGESIVAAAEEEGADLVVVGTHRRPVVGRLLLGSVSQYVVQHAGVPVLVARPLPARRLEPVTA